MRGRRVVYRCSSGHLFAKSWWWRPMFRSTFTLGLPQYTRCPIGKHWAFVRYVKEANLTAQERENVIELLGGTGLSDPMGRQWRASIQEPIGEDH